MAAKSLFRSSVKTTTATTQMPKNDVANASSHNYKNSAELETMKANLVRYARSDDRRMLLRSIREVKALNSLPLDGVQGSDGQLFELEKECATARIILNSIEVKGIRNNPGGEIPSTLPKDSCIPMLKGLCRMLCDKDGVKTSSRELYEKLIVRLAKTSSSADPYFRLNSLFGSSDLLLMPLDEQLSEKSEDKDTLTEMNAYASHGEIHMTLVQTYRFGLLRKSDVKTNRPWLIIHGVVWERANLSRNTGSRELKVVLPESN